MLFDMMLLIELRKYKRMHVDLYRARARARSTKRPRIYIWPIVRAGGGVFTR